MVKSEGLGRRLDVSSATDTEMSPLQEARVLLDLWIRALVDEPDAASLTLVQGAQAVIFEVSVSRQDVRRVIGRKGRTADALRELLTNLGGKVGRRYLLEILEPPTR